MHSDNNNYIIFKIKVNNLQGSEVIIMMFFGGWMWILWIVIIGLVVWGIIALVKHTSSTSNTLQKRSPLETARERYAKGEISKEEYEEIKKNLS